MSDVFLLALSGMALAVGLICFYLIFRVNGLHHRILEAEIKLDEHITKQENFERFRNMGGRL